MGRKGWGSGPGWGRRELDERVEELEAEVARLSRGGGLHWEYRSERTFRGWPLVHINQGIDPATGRPAVARGIIAMGNVAVGVFALGGLALGLFGLGGVSVGLLLSFGGVSLGGVAVGGAAFGGVALGGLAVGWVALGGAAFGAHALGGNAQDPRQIEWLRRLWPSSWR